jgi:DNA-binding NarL/FixJ family response regulator
MKAATVIRPGAGRQGGVADYASGKKQDVSMAVKQLISLVRQEKESRRPGADGKCGVLLSLVCDGVRCELVKVEEQTATAVDLDLADDIRNLLSPREMEISRMVARGYPNKTIAKVLELSVWTVGTYLRRIFAKLQVNCRAAMVDKVHELRLLQGH